MCLEISLDTNDHYYLLEHNGWYFAYKKFQPGLKPYYYGGSYCQTTDVFDNTWYSNREITQQKLAISGSISIRRLNPTDQPYGKTIPTRITTIQVEGVHCAQFRTAQSGIASDPCKIIKFRHEDIEYLGSYGEIVVRKFMLATEEETVEVITQVDAILQRNSKDNL